MNYEDKIAFNQFKQSKGYEYLQTRLQEKYDIICNMFIECYQKDLEDGCKEYSWWESWTYDKKRFENYVGKKYICYCNDYSIKELKSSLPAAQYIDWCRDHGVTDDSIKLDL